MLIKSIRTKSVCAANALEDYVLFFFIAIRPVLCPPPPRSVGVKQSEWKAHFIAVNASAVVVVSLRLWKEPKSCTTHFIFSSMRTWDESEGTVRYIVSSSKARVEVTVVYLKTTKQKTDHTWKQEVGETRRLLLGLEVLDDSGEVLLCTPAALSFHEKTQPSVR